MARQLIPELGEGQLMSTKGDPEKRRTSYRGRTSRRSDSSAKQSAPHLQFTNGIYKISGL